MELWIDEELKGCKFKDNRLKSRLLKIMSKVSGKIGESLPTVCQDWANTKAAYRFFSNPNLSESEILAGHFQATKERFQATDGPILVLHDTTEITYKRSQPADIGFTRKCANRNGLFNQEIRRAVCGILMHSSLVLTPEGLPLGFSAKKFWSRDKFKDVKALHRKMNATRIPIEEKESYRWVESLNGSNTLLGQPHRLVHIGDRESDIYEFFHAAIVGGSNFLVRIKVDRRTETETTTINKVMGSAKKKGEHKITYRDKDGEDVEVKLEIKFENLTIKPSFGLKSKNYADVQATVIFAKEAGKPKQGRKPIDWKLITNLPVESLADAIEKLQWYALR